MNTLDEYLEDIRISSLRNDKSDTALEKSTFIHDELYHRFVKMER